MAKKKNYRKIPANVRAQLGGFAVDDVVAACVKRLTLADVAGYSDLGMRLEQGELVLPPTAIPPEQRGKYSHANVNGRIRVRRDLPKIPKTFTIEAPNWHGSGTHDIDHTRMVYQRELIPPKELTLTTELIGLAANDFMVKFKVDQVLSRMSPDFEEDLLYNLNLLQENAGAAFIFESEATLADYLRTVHVQWEILPIGTVDEVLNAMLAGKPPVTVEQRRLMRERLTVLQRLGPIEYVAGTTGFLRYFGAKFADDFVAFENLTYGNALYVMFEQWDVLSRRTRVDLLSGPREGFERIIHTEGWSKRLESSLKNYRENRRQRGP